MNARPAPQFATARQQALAASLGMWVFLASELLFFGPLLAGYVYLRVTGGDAVLLAGRQTAYWLGTLNTALLLTSSLCMALAGSARRAGAGRRAAAWLGATAALGLMFLCIKGYEYHLEFGEHLWPGAGFAPAVAAGAAARATMELFFLLYFALTGLHALHLSIGVLFTAQIAWRLAQRRARYASTDAVEVLGLYWHFVDLVWIFLYPMLYLVGRAGA